jgi:hypothetical protein
MIYARIRYEDGFIREEENPKRIYGLKRNGERPISITVHDDGSFPPRGSDELYDIKECVYKQLRNVVHPTRGIFEIDESTSLGLGGSHNSQCSYPASFAKAY